MTEVAAAAGNRIASRWDVGGAHATAVRVTRASLRLLQTGAETRYAADAAYKDQNLCSHN
jgi:hypothetical protein